MKIDLDEIKENCFQLVQHLPARYEFAFAASLIEEFNLPYETDEIWSWIGQVPDFQVDHLRTISYLKETGYSDDFYMYFVKNRAATVATLFGHSPEICHYLAFYVVKSISLDMKMKSKLIRAFNQIHLPTIGRIH